LGGVGDLSLVSTISESCGVVKGKTGEGLDLVVEARKWKEEFGEVIYGKMEEWVRALRMTMNSLWRGS
jgi:hypothetical protein